LKKSLKDASVLQGKTFKSHVFKVVQIWEKVSLLNSKKAIIKLSLQAAFEKILERCKCAPG
jgi:hypothetical protein